MELAALTTMDVMLMRDGRTIDPHRPCARPVAVRGTWATSLKKENHATCTVLVQFENCSEDNITFRVRIRGYPAIPGIAKYLPWR